MGQIINSVEIICNNAGAFYVVKLLIDNGADVNARDKETKTPLYSFVFNGNVYNSNGYIVEPSIVKFVQFPFDLTSSSGCSTTTN